MQTGRANTSPFFRLIKLAIGICVHYSLECPSSPLAVIEHQGNKTLMSNISSRYLPALLLLGVLALAGCNDRNAGMGGLVIDAPPPPAPVARHQPQREDLANDDRQGNDEGRRGAGRRRAGWGRDRQLPGDSDDWGEDREMPSDDMPSDRQVTDNDREMPSDRMPSRTEKWGKDREMPSDSGNWGKNRRMPSDTAFQRRSDDAAESNSSSNTSRESDTASESGEE